MRHKLKMALIYLVGFATAMAIAAADPSAIKVQGPDTFGNVVYVQNTPPAGGGTTRTYLNGQGNGANSGITVTLTGAAGTTTYISGFYVTGLGATAASTASVQINNIQGGNVQFTLEVPAGVTTIVPPFSIVFQEPIPTTAQNTNITVTLAAFGAGNTDTRLTAWGYRQ